MNITCIGSKIVATFIVMKRIEEDTAYHRKLRRKLVNGIRAKGITDEEVLKAIEAVPRHFFIAVEQEELAYIDRALPIDKGQTISQPYTVAYQSQLLEAKPNDKILEIGTGSAYQACVLGKMGAEVYTIERQKKLFDKYLYFSYLRGFKNIHFFYGDGHEGMPMYAPFDKVLITAAAAYIPSPLINQLKPGGQLVMPLGSQELQQMIRITKNSSSELIKEYFHHFSFVPMLEGKEE